MFSIQIKLQGKQISESYYELEPEPEPQEEPQKLEASKTPLSDNAFNEDEEFKEMMRNFKTVSANDFERTSEKSEEAEISDLKEEISLNKTSTKGKDYAINSNETESYKKLQEELKQRLKNKQQAEQHAKTKSTLTYSLVGRTLLNPRTPRYLCERGGKIVVTIRVDEAGNVFDAYINGASNSNNQCLTNHAIEYAKSIQFDTSERKDQLGTITFLFKGKS